MRAFGDSPAARALAHLRPQFEHAPAAQPAQHDAAAGLVAGDAPERILRAARSHPVDREQQVAGLQPRLLSGTAHVQIADEHSGLRQTPLLRLLVREILRNDADPAADHPAVSDDVGHHPAHHVHRNGEADALDADVLGDDGGVDPDQRAAGVDERDRKSTRLNSSHSQISYAVFCLKKKKNKEHGQTSYLYYYLRT